MASLVITSSIKSTLTVCVESQPCGVAKVLLKVPEADTSIPNTVMLSPSQSVKASLVITSSINLTTTVCVESQPSGVRKVSTKVPLVVIGIPNTIIVSPKQASIDSLDKMSVEQVFSSIVTVTNEIMLLQVESIFATSRFNMTVPFSMSWTPGM